MKKWFRLLLIVSMLAALFATPVLAAPTAKSYLLVATSENSLPAGLEAAVAKAGGTLVSSLPQVGIAVAESSDSAFKAKAAKIAGVKDVLPNLTLQWIGPDLKVELGDDYGYPPASGDNDTRFDLQWGHTAVDAVGAWNKGQRGAGVRVAVLDSGIDADHPDLASKVNQALSVSFVPGENWNPLPGFYFNHGTHVAGTIAAADNGLGVIGVAPEAELIAVKVLSEFTGSGSFDWLISGIIYAADIDADVINMSLGAVLEKSGWVELDGTRVLAREVAELKNAISRATTYAYQQGTTVIASEGNDAIDKDHTADVITLPADAAHVISVAATAPIGWAKDPFNTFLDNPSSYTNFGQSAVDFAAPGGDFVYPGNESCTVAGITRPCYVFDYVFSTIPGGFSWAAGTSMAAPHVSGVAAIIIGMNGGDMKPSAVEAALRASADDLGKPGNDDFYGAGRVNAGNAVP
jgi:subtilisin family serine protease